MVTTMSILEEAVAGAGRGDSLVVEKLRGALLSLGSGAGGSPPSAVPAAMPPHDPDWLIPLGAILVALFALLCIMVYIIARWNTWKERARGVSMFEHECLMASLAMVLLIVLSLASFYYYFCFRGGCYGGALAKEASAAAGRKAKMMSR